MKIISVMLIAAIASCGAFAETIDLNGEWSFSRDGAPEMVVRVPHDWSIASVPTQGAPTGKEWGFYAGGKGEYRRTFDIAEALRRGIRQRRACRKGHALRLHGLPRSARRKG